MKKFLPLFAIFLLSACHISQKTVSSQEQSPVVIQGQITGFSDSTKVYLYNQSLEKYIDSTLMVQNHFKMQTVLPEDSVPELLVLWFKEGKNPFTYVNLFVRNGDKVLVTGDKKDMPFNMKIEGSSVQDEMNALMAEEIPYELKIKELYKEMMQLDRSEKAKRDSLFALIDRLQKSADSVEKDYIRRHPNTFAAAVVLGFQKELFPKDSIKIFLDQMCPVIRKSKYGQILENYVNSGPVEEGYPYRDFTAMDTTGRQVRFSEIIQPGKNVLLEFTSAGCMPCVFAAKELNRIHRDYGDRVQIVSFSTDVSEKSWERARRRDHVVWTSLWDGQGRYSPVLAAYGIEGVPTFFLIDPQGKIKKKFFGYGEGLLIKTLKKEGAIPAGEH